MKKWKIAFWTSTILIALFEGLMPALTFNTEMAKEGTRHLGYPEYVMPMLVVFKVLGSITLLAQNLKSKRIKEWAYAGFTFDFILASYSHYSVDGLTFDTFFPLLVLLILLVSYFSFHKMNDAQ